jgi:ATP-dependent DNA helicase RecG
MQTNYLITPIEYLKGVGPNRADLLKKELDIFTFEDLLLHFPFRYVDRSKFYKVNEVNDDLPYVQLMGKLIRWEKIGEKRAGRLVGTFRDESGTMELVWFRGTKWISTSLELNKEYVVFGKPSKFNQRYNIVHPEMELASTFRQLKRTALHAVYPSTDKLNNAGLNSRAILKLQQNLVAQLNKNAIRETLSDELLQRHHLMDKQSALTHLHFPENSTQLSKAQYRIKFEELFFIQLKLLMQKLINERKLNGYCLEKIGHYFNTFYHQHLDFQLTEAQKKVIKEIRMDVNTGHQMNRLLQGDVGSGKTIVATMTLLMAIDNGFQGCVMAPTELLAKQHYESISSMLAALDVSVALLTGSTKSAKRKQLHEDLVNGSIHILIGTHALTEDPVKFNNLGVAIIDEQHRFGVAHRAKLWKKNTSPPHVLVMTATPIPRTLAMTLYGDLDVSIIDELPQGRKPIKTSHRFDSSRLKVFGFMEKQIELGRQIYIVYPLIKESEKLDYKDLMDGYESIVRRFPPPKYQLSIVHGKMKAVDKDFEMDRFIKRETQIMVATTVIEVGINVPNASVMIIESAERFGLSQLHQLRGRVGRGADQSYCILMTGHKLSGDGKLRMETMVNSSDGFEIAEVDLKLRGPGDLHGTQQSGLPFGLKLANLSKDGQLIKFCRDVASEILKNDPLLEQTANAPIKKQYLKHINSTSDWGRIL